MNSQKVSIIIPVYNRELLIAESLDSILQQSYSNWECIVVDDGSTDATEKIILKYCKNDSRFKYYKRPTDRLKGANACRNYGFELSKGNYIQWFDSDDLMHKDKLKKKVDLLKHSSANFGVCEGIEYEGNTQNVIQYWNNICSENPLIDHIIGKVNFHTNGPLFKREFLKGKILFNETLQRKQEWEFYSRLLSFSTNYICLNEVLYYFRSHENSINGNNEISTLHSRIKATNLIFENVKNRLDNNSLAILREHFLHKAIFHFKLAKESNKINLIYFSVKSTFMLFNFEFFVKALKKIIYKPKILNNIFSKNESR